MNQVKVGNFTIGGAAPLALLAGPCVLESLERSLLIGRTVKEICGRLGINYVFKASFDKANRSSFHSFRGPGLTKGIAWLKTIKEELGVPIVTDIHETTQAEPVAKVADILQIPAFLCRQTDLLHAAAQTGRVVNVKKGQFLAPEDMRNVVDKLHECGCEQMLLTERGASFGYHNLVVDMRSLPIMRSLGYPVVFDGTHSVQLPGGNGTTSSGNREYVEYLVRAAAGAGIDALFLEVHDNPEEALSDGANMVYLDKLEGLLTEYMPNVNMIQIIQTHIKNEKSTYARVRDMGRDLAASSYRAAKGSLEAAEYLGLASRMLTRGQLKVNTQIMSSDKALRQLGGIIDRMSMAIVIAGLFIGSSVVYYARIEPVVFGIPVIGFMGYVSALVLALMLGRNIWLNSHGGKH